MVYAPAATIIATPIGPVRIVATGDLVAEIRIGDSRESFGSSPILQEAAEQLRAYFAGRLTRFDLPLKPASTQRRSEIWSAMREIGYGRVATYGEIAERAQSIARAVGQACRHNPLPIVIPCHRILQAGYRLGPYSAGEGPTTKLKLLEHERAEGWLL